MGWFDEQIRQRKAEDDKIFRESLKEAATTILGSRQAYMADDHALTANALEKILRFYHLEYREAPKKIDTLEGRLDYALSPQGMMYRKVALEGKWYSDGAGAFLGFLKDGDTPVALIPSGFSRYRCYNPATGDSYFIGRSNADTIKRDAYCFYRPFPQKKMSIPILARYLLGCLRMADIILIAGVSLVSIGVGFLVPRLTFLLFGPVLESRNVSVLAAMAVFMVCVKISMLIVSAGQNLITGCVQTRLKLNIESATMMRLLSMPPDFFRQYNSGELSSRMQSVNSLCSALASAVLSSGLPSLMSLLYITQIFRYTPVLVVPSLVLILLSVGFSSMTVILEMGRQKKMMEQDAKTLGLSVALVNGIQKIRLAGAEKRIFAHWAQQYNKSASLQYSPPLILKVNSVLNEAIRMIGTIVLYSIALAGAVTMKDYMSFNAAYGMVMGAFASLASVVMVFARIKPVLDMASPILDTVPETADHGIMVTDLKGNIELNNVRILLGFEKPERGAIFYDGRRLDQLDLRSLRRKIGTVMQSGALFNDSIYSNITISAPSLPMEKAWEAAEIACIAEDIREMPMGMYTMISEGQGGISGGQKQRLMIARAIAPRPSILIFDEATSALDNIAQKKVTQALDELHCTRVVIAHRLSTIRSCSRILYLGNGKVLEEGTYEELMAKNGLFADMVARQQL